jgi:hypothetical protein
MVDLVEQEIGAYGVMSRSSDRRRRRRTMNKASVRMEGDGIEEDESLKIGVQEPNRIDFLQLGEIRIWGGYAGGSGCRRGRRSVRGAATRTGLVVRTLIRRIKIDQ